MAPGSAHLTPVGAESAAAGNSDGRATASCAAPQLELQPLRQRIVAILGTTDDAMVCKSPDGVVASWNPGAAGPRPAWHVRLAARRDIDAEAPDTDVSGTAQVRTGVGRYRPKSH